MIYEDMSEISQTLGFILVFYKEGEEEEEEEEGIIDGILCITLVYMNLSSRIQLKVFNNFPRLALSHSTSFPFPFSFSFLFFSFL